MPAEPARKSRLTLVIVLLAALLTMPGASFAFEKSVHSDGPDEPRIIAADGSAVSGELFQLSVPPALQATDSTRVLCFTTKTGNSDPCARVNGLFPYTIVVQSLSEFPLDLSSYNAIYIGYSEGNAVKALAGRFATYVQDGGGLILEQPNLEGPVEFLPAGFELWVTDVTWPGFPTSLDPAEFTSAGAEHPILSDLTADDLSGNFDTVPIGTLGPGWMVLARSVDYPHVALAAGSYGSGRVVFHTGNIGATSADQGSNMYLWQMIQWTGSAAASPARTFLPLIIR